MKKVRIAAIMLAGGLAASGLAACSGQASNAVDAPAASSSSAVPATLSNFTIGNSGYFVLTYGASQALPIVGGSITGTTGQINLGAPGNQGGVTVSLTNIQVSPQKLTANFTLDGVSPGQITLTSNSYGQYSGTLPADSNLLTSIVDLDLQEPPKPFTPATAQQAQQLLQQYKKGQ